MNLVFYLNDSGANAQVKTYSSVAKSALPTKEHGVVENAEEEELENSQTAEDMDSSVSLERKSPSDSHSSPLVHSFCGGVH